MVQYRSQCHLCRWHQWETDSCKAFPKGIPEQIMYGHIDHRKPYKGDHGTRWAPKKGFGDRSHPNFGRDGPPKVADFGPKIEGEP